MSDWKSRAKIVPSNTDSTDSDTSSGLTALEQSLYDKSGALAAGLVKGGTLGFADEIAGGIGAAGKKLAEKAGISEDSGESLEDLYNRYKELTQKSIDEAQEKSVLGKVGEIGGNVALGALALPATAGLGATMAAGAALGGVQAAGESEADLLSKQMAEDVGTGAVSGAAFGAVGQGVAKGLGSLSKKMLDSQLASQLAMTAKNVDEGGTIFGKEAGDIIRSKSDKLASQLGEEIINPISKRSRAFGEAFEQADAAGQKLAPGIDDLKTISDAENVLGTSFSDDLKKLKEGAMTPQEANAFRTRFNNFINDLKTASRERVRPSLFDKAEKLKETGLTGKVEELSSKAGTDIKGLNKDLYDARKMVEEILSLKDTSGKSKEELSEEAMSQINKLLGRQGQTTLQGDVGRKELADVFKTASKYAKENKDIGFNPESLVDKVSEQSLLNAARRNITGVTEASTESSAGLLKSLGEKMVQSPYAVTEAVAKGRLGSSLQKSTKGLSEKILKADKIQLKNMSDEFGKNPELKKLGEELAAAVESGSKQKLNSVLFTISQTAPARAIANTIVPDAE